MIRRLLKVNRLIDEMENAYNDKQDTTIDLYKLNQSQREKFLKYLERNEERFTEYASVKSEYDLLRQRTMSVGLFGAKLTMSPDMLQDRYLVLEFSERSSENEND